MINTSIYNESKNMKCNFGVKMKYRITLKELAGQLDFFSKMYDCVRIVDPSNKRVIEQNNTTLKTSDQVCYDYWANKKICDNCISVRAHKYNECFYKLEQSPEALMMVTAIPVDTDTPTVLELLKNATQSMMVGTGDYNEGQRMYRFAAEINNLIVRDELTKLYNRRYVDERLPADIVKSTIEKWPISIAFMDIDNLKTINDVYGHKEGDKALRKISNIITRSIRNNVDWAARYGGDEIVVCLNNTDEQSAYIIAERIRKQIEEDGIDIPGSNVSTTVSIGILTVREKMMTSDKMIEVADQNMYRAKRNGKNCVIATFL